MVDPGTGRLLMASKPDPAAALRRVVAARQGCRLFEVLVVAP